MMALTRGARLWAPVAVAAALVVGACAKISEPVATDAGLVSGTDSPIPGVRAFLGIPFGAPPVGDFRWREPQPVEPWDGVRQADDFSDVCVQPKGHGRLNVSVDLPDSPAASEDCLYLNVWTAAKSAEEKRPVMVWIFGGAYTEGAGSSPHNHGHTLAEKGVVAVSFNYRLGPFGFLSHPELTKTSGHDASGNYALMDAIAALRWVKANIAAFGGDPDNVTIFGESAGGAIISGLVGSPEAAGLFDRAISESAGWMGLGMAPMRTLAEAEAAGKKAADAIGAQTAEDLRALTAEDVTAGFRGSGMIVDGWIVPEDLSITFAEGRQNAVDLIVGSNRDEGMFIPAAPPADVWQAQARDRWGDLADEFLALYPAGTQEETYNSVVTAFSDDMAWHMRLFADTQAQVSDRVYLYYFTYEPPYPPDARDLKAVHTVEIPYVFDNLGVPRVYPDASSPEMAAASPRDQAFADRMSAYWVNFAATGDPNGEDLPPWPRYRPGDPGTTMILDDDLTGESIPAEEKFRLFDALYERQMSRY